MERGEEYEKNALVCSLSPQGGERVGREAREKNADA
jgi:hypothetical protein